MRGLVADSWSKKPSIRFAANLLARVRRVAKKPRRADQAYTVPVLHMTVSEDTVRTVLDRRIGAIRWGGAWIVALGFAVTFLSVLVSADFQNYILDAEAWRAVFGLGLIASTLSTVYLLVRHPKRIDSEVVISELRSRVHDSPMPPQQRGISFTDEADAG